MSPHHDASNRPGSSRRRLRRSACDARRNGGRGPFFESLERKLALAATTPAQPVVLDASPGNGQISLTWTAPGDGGSPLTGYDIAYRDIYASPSLKHLYVPASATSATLARLINDAPYSISVAAINSTGTGKQASLPTILPTATPAPTLGVPRAGDAKAFLSWTAPARTVNGNTVAGYVIQSSTDNGATWKGQASTSISATTTSATAMPLVNGVTYRFRVAAKLKSGGTTPWSGQSGPITPQPVPNAPAQLAASAGDRQLLVSWEAPRNAGPILNYVVQYSTDRNTWQTVSGLTTGTSTTIGSLVNGTAYSVRVQAVNATGRSDSSAFVTATPTAPGSVPASPPVNLSATAGTGLVSLAWTVPASTGGSAISDYLVQYSSDGGSSWNTVSRSRSSSTSATVGSLTNGVGYTFRVAAVNGAGTSSFSPTATATPRAPVANMLINNSTGYAIAVWQKIDRNGVGLGAVAVVNPGSSTGFTNPTGQFYIAAARSTNLVSRWHTVVSPNYSVSVTPTSTYTVSVGPDTLTGLLRVAVNGRVARNLYASAAPTYTGRT